MPNNVYIGSRYVPLFDGAWDSTKSYEALTIVEYGNNSYTSKKPVPVGTLPTNTTYWALSGNYNGQISNIQSQINDMKDGTVSGSLQNQINFILGDIIQLKGKTIAVFGSSNEIDGYSGGTNWVTLMSNMLSGYATVVNKSVAGRGVVTAITDFINDTDKSTYDIILFTCMKNQFLSQTVGDYYSGINLLGKGNIETAIESLHTYLSIGQEVYFANCTPYVNAAKAYPMCFFDGIVQRACEKNGFKTLNMRGWVNTSNENSSSYTLDGTHYKSENMPIWAARCIRDLARGGSQFSFYSCDVEGSEVWNNHGLVLATGITAVEDSSYPNVIKANTNLEAYFRVKVKNSTGAELPAGSTLLNITNSIFSVPAFYINKQYISVGSSGDILNYSYSVRTENAISDNGVVMLSNTYPHGIQIGNI